MEKILVLEAAIKELSKAIKSYESDILEALYTDLEKKPSLCY